jgi:hypothetical protein
LGLDVPAWSGLPLQIQVLERRRVETKLANSKKAAETRKGSFLF